MSDRKFTVVIIDDNEADRHIYRRYLQQASLDYEVHEAEDGKSGLDLARTLKPDCVLLDLRLIQESGYEVLHAINEGHPQLRVPVIMLTSARSKPLEEWAYSLGASDYLIKGRTDATALDTAIRRAIARSKSDVGTEL